MKSHRQFEIGAQDMDGEMTKPADDEIGVASLYQDGSVAGNYLDERLRFSWQRLLHEKQLAALNRIIASYSPVRILELAPGPARLSVSLKGVRQGVMVENSEEMISIARKRLRDSGLDQSWRIIHGNAFDLDALIEESSCDFCFTFRFIRHFRLKDRERLYGLLRHRLTPNGLLMFDVVGKSMRGRIEAKQKGQASRGLCVYDVSYSEADFQKEMEDNGFKVIFMDPVVRCFNLQSWLSHKFDDILNGLTMTAVSLLEKFPSRHPVEWIALCQRMGDRS
jgi:hypothetical protein